MRAEIQRGQVKSMGNQFAILAILECLKGRLAAL